MTASKKRSAPQDDTSSSAPPAGVTPKLNEERAIQALVEQIEVALGRRPVTVTQINRKTGKVEKHEKFTPNGLVAARNLETAFRVLQMFDGRLRYRDLPPPKSTEEQIDELREIVRRYDERHAPKPASADSVGADQQHRDHRQPGEHETQPTIDKQKSKKDRPTHNAWPRRVRPRDHSKYDKNSSAPPAYVTPKLTETWAVEALAELIDVALGRRPVTVTLINRKTGKVETLERLMPDGRAAGRSLETLFRALKMFDGRWSYQDEVLAPRISLKDSIGYMRGIIRRFDERRAAKATLSAVADRQDQDRQQPGEAEVEPTVDQEKKQPARQPSSAGEWVVVSPPGLFPHQTEWRPKKQRSNQ